MLLFTVTGVLCYLYCTLREKHTSVLDLKQGLLSIDFGLDAMTTWIVCGMFIVHCSSTTTADVVKPLRKRRWKVQKASAELILVVTYWHRVKVGIPLPITKSMSVRRRERKTRSGRHIEAKSEPGVNMLGSSYAFTSKLVDAHKLVSIPARHA